MTHAADFQPSFDAREFVVESVRRLVRGWHRLPATVRSRTFSAGLAMLAVLGLLLAFHQVVQGAVDRGALRRAAVAAQAHSARQCNALPSLRLRDDCLLALNTEPADGGAPQARPVER